MVEKVVDFYDRTARYKNSLTCVCVCVCFSFVFRVCICISILVYYVNYNICITSIKYVYTNAVMFIIYLLYGIRVAH